MTLGFAIDDLVARARGGGALRMGLSRLDDAAWLRPEPDRAARAAAFEADPDALIVLPEAAAAAHEVAAMLGVGGGLGEAARHVHEDLCLLQRDGDTYRLTAGAVAWPTDWRLADKIGKPLLTVHAPIHGYAEHLATGVDHFLTTLPAGPIYARANWFVVDADTMRYPALGRTDPPFAHVTTQNAGRILFVRAERQTLRRLPETGAILFTIGIAVEPLDALSDATIAKVAAATDTLLDGEHTRRGVAGYAAALSAYAAARSFTKHAA